MKITILKNCSIVLIAVYIMLFTSCSTQKNTFPNRAYHTTTSKFNVNFNGKEALKSGEAELAKKSKDNYTSLLPIYYYPAKNDLGSIFPSMDRVIEKASKSISKHSMFIRGKEYVKTIDDAYLLMGKAYFHKQDYIQAQRIFNYIKNNYKGWDCYDEAMILNARCALRQNYYSQSLTLLDEAFYSFPEKKSKKLNVMYNVAVAEYHLTAPDGEIPTAIDYINDAIDNKPKKAFRTRLYFILGQLYESNGQLADAQKCFTKVIRSAPAYEMEFSAQMHLATNYDGTNSSRNAIMKILNKMLEEKKNEEYRDQIYYAISEIARIDENEELRLENLKKSVATYSNNDYQRTYSSVILADILFEKNEYMDAQAYYDTAVMSIPNNYPNKEAILKKSLVLKDLVTNLQVILLEDSLQRIAKMNPGQRQSWVNKMIADYTEEERRLAKEEADRMLALQSSMSMANINVNTSQSGKWYFYNSSLISAGQTDFYRRWGNRKLEDNWRISNKQQISFEDLANMNDPNAAQDSVQYDEDGNPIKQRETDPKKPDYWLQDLPLTEGAMDTSNIKIANALYNAGLIYQDLLQDIPRANESFEKLATRFPEHELTLPAIYLLYLNYSNAGDPKSETYKYTILNKYADTDFAKLILDPTYYQKLAEKNKEMETRYEVAYQSYIAKQWNKTIQLAEEALPNCNDKILKSKYAYIHAVAIGQVQGEDSLKKALSQIIINFPGTDVEDLAKTYLSLFASNIDEALAEAGDSTAMKNLAQAAEKQAENENPFKYLPDELHYIVVIFETGVLAVSDVKNSIAAFNREFFSLTKFNINSFYINQTQQMITISKFKNASTAMDYYGIMINNENFKTNIDNKIMTIYSLSATNYTTFYNKTNQRALYPEFFQINYLKQTEIKQ